MKSAIKYVYRRMVKIPVKICKIMQENAVMFFVINKKLL